MKKFYLLFVFLGSLMYPSLSAQDAVETEDKTLSPYFFVMSPDTSVDQMPLKSTSAEARVSGVIANVSVKQTYCNEGDSVLEAIYVFPASTRAAAAAMAGVPLLNGFLSKEMFFAKTVYLTDEGTIPWLPIFATLAGAAWRRAPPPPGQRRWSSRGLRRCRRCCPGSWRRRAGCRRR